MKPTLQEFNSILTELLTAYRAIAAKLGITENELWILYELLSAEDVALQRELCEKLGVAKQTINSALRKMEQAGHIEQKTGKDRRTREVHLTASGRKLAARTAGRLMQAETSALQSLGAQLCQNLFTGLREYTRELRNDKIL